MSSPGLLYEPADPGFSVHAPEIYRTLRDEHPAYEDPRGRFWAISRFADVRDATLDWERYSNTGKIETLTTKPTLNSLDPPRHGQLRKLVSRAFTPRRVADLEAGIRVRAGRLIDEFVEEGSCDAMESYASLLPSMVMGELLGLRDDLVPVCRALTDASKRRVTPEGGAEPAARSYEIFAELYAERRKQRRDDLLSALVDAEVDGVRLTEDELLAFGWLLLVGGNDTTTNLIGNGIEVLARHPAVRAELVQDPSLIASAVEEMLRLVPPTHSLPRRAAVDVELHGRCIPKDSRVMLLWHAANLDEREYPEPEAFDIHRRATRHLALGNGTHFCMGAALARLEARVAFEELLRRVPEYDIAAEPDRLVSIIFNGFETLPIEFSAR
jgi:cytochrome P450 family 130